MKVKYDDDIIGYDYDINVNMQIYDNILYNNGHILFQNDRELISYNLETKEIIKSDDLLNLNKFNLDNNYYLIYDNKEITLYLNFGNNEIIKDDKILIVRTNDTEIEFPSKLLLENSGLMEMSFMGFDIINDSDDNAKDSDDNTKDSDDNINNTKYSDDNINNTKYSDDNTKDSDYNIKDSCDNIDNTKDSDNNVDNAKDSDDNVDNTKRLIDIIGEGFEYIELYYNFLISLNSKINFCEFEDKLKNEFKDKFENKDENVFNVRESNLYELFKLASLLMDKNLDIIAELIIEKSSI